MTWPEIYSRENKTSYWDSRGPEGPRKREKEKEKERRERRKKEKEKRERERKKDKKEEKRGSQPSQGPRPLSRV
jgi:hypothetical protein